MTAGYELRELPLRIEGYALERVDREVSSAFTRTTTSIRMYGDGHEGIGEDVTYETRDHDALHEAGARLDLSGARSFGELVDRVDRLDLFPRPPVQEAARRYRRWAFESAALDLALRQAGRSLAEQLGRRPRPVTFVVSLRLGTPPTADRVHRLRERYPGLRFKLDPTSDWTDSLVRELAATGAVVAVDLKGAYRDTVVDQPADPELYALVAEGLPDAWIEDPDLSGRAAEVLRPHRERITWDAILHGVADIEALDFRPRMINVKPSRFGSFLELLRVYEFCEANSIGTYGGGQFELGHGRGQIQYLASLFHPDSPNDVAPAGFNEPQPPAGLPSSPLAPPPSAAGFRWANGDPRGPS